MEESHDPGQPPFQSSGSFSNFEAEFKTWKQPSETLDPNSFIFSASEIFRFLRDMALDMPTAHSTSLLSLVTGNGDGVRNREKNFYGAPPITSRKGRVGSPTQHLIHPGAVLCMMDLLPAVTPRKDFIEPDPCSSEFGGASSQLGGHGMSPGRGMSPVADAMASPSKSANRSPSRQSEDSFYDAVGVMEGEVPGVESGGVGEAQKEGAGIVGPGPVDLVEVIVEREELEKEYSLEELGQVCGLEALSLALILLRYPSLLFSFSFQPPLLLPLLFSPHPSCFPSSCLLTSFSLPSSSLPPPFLSLLSLLSSPLSPSPSLYPFTHISSYYLINCEY